MPTSEQIEKAAIAMAFARRTRHDQSRDASEFWENTGYETRLMHISCATAALSAAEGVKPRVKPLVWIGLEGDPGNDLSAHPTPFMHYRLRHLREGSFDVVLNTDTGVKWFSESAPRHATYDEAKAAAQADYEARIRSALEGE